MTDGRRQEVRLEIRIDAAPETVFALLTEPAQMQTWLAEAVDANARPARLDSRALAAAARSNTINRFLIKNGNGDAATRLTSEAPKVR